MADILVLGAIVQQSQASNTNVGISNVRLGVTYNFQNVLYTGNARIPTISDVKVGVAYDTLDSLVGTYDGTDRHTDPGINNVRLSTAYKSNSLTNNRTGNLRSPLTSNVRLGSVYDSLDSLSGTLDLPAVSNVRLSTVFDNTTKTGTLNLPISSDVKLSVSYDNGSSIGSYDGSDRHTDPNISNVRLGVNYKSNSLTNNKTGNARIPLISQVKINTLYDSSDSLTGVYEGSDRWSDPSDANVRVGIPYKANSLTNNKTGRVTVPIASNVRVGITFDTDLSITGTYGDETAPTFGGITGLLQEPSGALLASWSAGSDPTVPLSYKVYIQALNDVGLFSTTPYVTQTLSLSIFSIPGGTILNANTLYYVGVRATDRFGNTELNTITLSETSLGVSTGQVSYESHGVFSINALNQLKGSLWVTGNGKVQTALLSTASYSVYDSTGSLILGLSEIGVTPDVNGLFEITPVLATALSDLDHYVIKITILVNAIPIIAYRGITLGE